MTSNIEYGKYLCARELFNSLRLTSEVDNALDKLVADAVAIEEDLDEEDKGSGDKEWDEVHKRLYPNDTPEKKIARINSAGTLNQIEWLIRQGYTELDIISHVYNPTKQIEWMTQEGYTREFITSLIERVTEFGWSEEEIKEALRNFNHDTSSCPEAN